MHCACVCRFALCNVMSLWVPSWHSSRKEQSVFVRPIIYDRQHPSQSRFRALGIALIIILRLCAWERYGRREWHTLPKKSFGQMCPTCQHCMTTHWYMEIVQFVQFVLEILFGMLCLIRQCQQRWTLSILYWYCTLICVPQGGCEICSIAKCSNVAHNLFNINEHPRPCHEFLGNSSRMAHEHVGGACVPLHVPALYERVAQG